MIVFDPAPPELRFPILGYARTLAAASPKHLLGSAYWYALGYYGAGDTLEYGVCYESGTGLVRRHEVLGIVSPAPKGRSDLDEHMLKRMYPHDVIVSPSAKLLHAHEERPPTDAFDWTSGDILLGSGPVSRLLLDSFGPLSLKKEHLRELMDEARQRVVAGLVRHEREAHTRRHDVSPWAWTPTPSRDKDVGLYAGAIG